MRFEDRRPLLLGLFDRVPGFHEKLLLSADGALLGGRTLVRAVVPQPPRLHPILKVRFQDLYEPLPAVRVLHGDEQLHPSVEVPRHPVGAGQEHPFVPAVQEVQDPSSEVVLEEARFEDPSFELGDVLEEEVPFAEFGRTAVQAAKQRIIQRVREGERSRIREEFAGKVGELLMGEVQQIERGKIVVMLNRFREAEAIIPYREQNHREHFHQGEPIRAVLKRIAPTLAAADTALPDVPRTPFRRPAQTHGLTRTVALLTGCVMPNLYPRTHEATVRVLNAIGYRVVAPEAQTCCGQPAFNSGYRKQARQVARHFLRVFRDAECVVVPSGSCTSMIVHHYEEIFHKESEGLETAERLAPRVYEFSKFLLEVAGVEDVGARYDGVVTYHDSCHALRELGLWGTRPASKFIPDRYLYNDAQVRLAVLQGLLDTDADHSLVELTQLVDQWGEVAVTGAHDERRDVVPLERHLQRVDRHLDIGRVLTRCPHTLRHLDELDMRSGEHPAIFVEVGPVGVRPTYDDPPALGEGDSDGPEVERHSTEMLSGSQCQVLVIEVQGNAFFLIHPCHPTWCSRFGRSDVATLRCLIRERLTTVVGVLVLVRGLASNTSSGSVGFTQRA